VFEHVGLHVYSLDASVRFYGAALAPLGYVLCGRDAASAWFGPPNEPALWLYADGATTNAHIAFRAPDRASVDSFHRRGVEAGGRDHGAPGLRTDYTPTYYAAFLRDPDGNNIEAVCVAAP